MARETGQGKIDGFTVSAQQPMLNIAAAIAVRICCVGRTQGKAARQPQRLFACLTLTCPTLVFCLLSVSTPPSLSLLPPREFPSPLPLLRTTYIVNITANITSHTRTRLPLLLVHRHVWLSLAVRVCLEAPLHYLHLTASHVAVSEPQTGKNLSGDSQGLPFFVALKIARA